jgi:hypothetical protein
LSTRDLSFKAEFIPIDTWSSLLAEVGMLSTDAGCARILFSDTRAAAVTCNIIYPDERPGLRDRKGGRPLRSGLTSRSNRLSEILARSASARAA